MTKTSTDKPVVGNYYPRVGGLGGCTEHNAMLSILPANNDWDYIKNITGDNNWDAQNMRGYYKKLENNQYIIPNDITAHGYGGWLSQQLTPIILVAQDLKIISLVIAAASTIGVNTDDLVGKVSKLVDGVLGTVSMASIYWLESIADMTIASPWQPVTSWTDRRSWKGNFYSCISC